ncbi:hypothetical protein [Nocardiopsis sp. CNR-923]|uniref:hypothetical protein n=1 Tax=Nocardiopsis sp. CNR-923 TaxID=1904965 RepID=UPI001301510A|nr:hypothetical protein [Nocardiopsis sp. CNR-923]
MRACQLRPELATTYADVEWEIGDVFKPDLSMLELIALAEGRAVDNDRLILLRLRTNHNRTARRLRTLAKKAVTVADYLDKAGRLQRILLDLQTRMRALGYDGAHDDWSLTS